MVNPAYSQVDRYDEVLQYYNTEKNEIILNPFGVMNTYTLTGYQYITPPGFIHKWRLFENAYYSPGFNIPGNKELPIIASIRQGDRLVEMSNVKAIFIPAI